MRSKRAARRKGEEDEKCKCSSVVSGAAAFGGEEHYGFLAGEGYSGLPAGETLVFTVVRTDDTACGRLL